MLLESFLRVRMRSWLPSSPAPCTEQCSNSSYGENQGLGCVACRVPSLGEAGVGLADKLSKREVPVAVAGNSSAKAEEFVTAVLFSPWESP